jgi:hypothetical protein
MPVITADTNFVITIGSSSGVAFFPRANEAFAKQLLALNRRSKVAANCLGSQSAT